VQRARLQLLWEFVRREIARQYKGSRLGIAWTVLNPLFLLVIYTVVFSAFLGFRARGETGGRGQSGGLQYALMIFSGMVPFRVLSEAMTRSAGCISANVDLVKRVVFPAEILPVSVALAAFANGLFGLVVLLAMALVVQGTLPITLVYLPAIWAVQLMMAVAIAYFLSAAGTLVRDIGAVMPHATMALMFLTPVVYPLDMLPARFQALEMLNPAAIIVLSHRNAVLYGEQPLWLPLGVLAGASLVLLYAGRRWFLAQKRFFPEVL
jgi:lipopolysaccharide transport system permease protein